MSSGISQEYMFARLHGLWMRSVHGESLQTLAKAGSTDVLVRMLHDYGVEGGEDRNGFHKHLVMRENSVMNGIRKLLSGSLSEYYRSFIGRSYYENVKTLVHYRYHGDRGVPFSFLLTDIEGYQKMSPGKALEARTVEDFISALSLREHTGELEVLLRQVDRDEDVMKFDSGVDRLMYGDLLSSARGLDGRMGKEARELAGEEIDIVNLFMLFRNQTTYHETREAFRGNYLPGGQFLSIEKLEEMTEESHRDRVISHLPMRYSHVLQPISQGALYVLENALWCGLNHRAHRLFMDFEDQSLSLVSFPYLKHIETKNISRVYEGLHFGVSSRDLLGILIA